MKYIYFFISLLLYVGLAYWVERASFGFLISSWSLLFGLYVFLLREPLSTQTIFIFGFLFRLVWIFAIPALSDDFNRFIWDGRLLIHGLNPYTILPADFIHQANFQNVIGDVALFHKLNSPSYYTIYPPLNQWIFAFCAWVARKSNFANIVALRSVIVLADILVFWVITNLQKHHISFHLKNHHRAKASPLSLYFLNPLIIIELCGNLHFEGLMLLFILLSILLITKHLYFFSSLAFSCAVSIKMLPLIFIPLIINYLTIKNGLKYAFSVMVFCLIGTLPFVDNLLITRLSSSIGLYFQRFEFNASLYYLIRAWGYAYYGYNIIAKAGLILSLFSVLSLIILSFRLKRQPLSIGFLFLLGCYFSFALVVHPWYICTLVGLAVLTPYRFAILWSFLVGFSYIAYASTPVQENLWFISIEYIAVWAFLLYELKKGLPLASPSQ